MPDDPKPEVNVHTGIGGAIDAGVTGADRLLSSKWNPLQVILVACAVSFVFTNGMVAYLLVNFIADRNKQREADDRRAESAQRHEDERLDHILKDNVERIEREKNFYSSENAKARTESWDRAQALVKDVMTHCSLESENQRRSDMEANDKMSKALTAFGAELGKFLKKKLPPDPDGGDELLRPVIAPPPRKKVIGDIPDSSRSG